ncbi:MAG TPA: thymidine kinase [Firmicutes bacterium]|nr:thymidine kinase [Caldisericia bacterium]HDH63427.1 thymidine kinase [Bacillota bacterium]
MKKGWIEVITGCMFSGKSEELIRRVRRAKIARQKVQVFKSSLDTRYDEAKVVSHSGAKVEAISVDHPEEIIAKIDDDTQVVAIDEAQFFSEKIVDVIEFLADRGIRVIVAGLDLDFRGEPFGPMPALLARAEKVDKLTAICMVCGEEATRTQRIIDGKPASYYDPVVMIGAQEKYEARCRRHHIVPDKPNIIQRERK